MSDAIAVRPIDYGIAKPLLDDRPKDWPPADPDADYYGAFIGDQVVGVAAIKWAKSYARFKSDWVLAEHRRQGVGQKLFTERLADVRERGLTRVKATCTVDSLKMYQREGAEILKRHGKAQSADVVITLTDEEQTPPARLERAAAKTYSTQNVFDAALDRIRWLYDEFPEVVVSVSGGKDSTVVFELAMIVAKEKNRLPLRVSWIDQEAEWASTVDTIGEQMTRPGVIPRWYQMPIRIFNATSTTDHWLRCWSPDDEHRWVHPKNELSVKENVYGTERFTELFKAIPRVEFPNSRVCYLGGVRAEESPGRAVGMTSHSTYRGATWGLKLNKVPEQVCMYPIYDWSYTDVWKAIHDNGWPYNPLYDVMYQHGVTLPFMRVSNLHHETALHQLWMLQEIEPETWNNLAARIGGIDAVTKVATGASEYFVKDLPPMFADWIEYRDYLLDVLIDDPKWTEGFVKKFAQMESKLDPGIMGDKLYRVQCNSIITNDWEHIKLDNFMGGAALVAVRQKQDRERAALNG